MRLGEIRKMKLQLKLKEAEAETIKIQIELGEMELGIQTQETKSMDPTREVKFEAIRNNKFSEMVEEEEEPEEEKYETEKQTQEAIENPSIPTCKSKLEREKPGTTITYLEDFKSEIRKIERNMKADRDELITRMNQELKQVLEKLLEIEEIIKTDNKKNSTVIINNIDENMEKIIQKMDKCECFDNMNNSVKLISPAPNIFSLSSSFSPIPLKSFTKI